MKLIDADDLYQKCIEIQLKKRNRYFDIDDVIKLIKKAPTIDILDKIRAEITEKKMKVHDAMMRVFAQECIDIIDKYGNEVSE